MIPMDFNLIIVVFLFIFSAQVFFCGRPAHSESSWWAICKKRRNGALITFSIIHFHFNHLSGFDIFLLCVFCLFHFCVAKKVCRFLSKWWRRLKLIWQLVRFNWFSCHKCVLFLFSFKIYFNKFRTGYQYIRRSASTGNPKMHINSLECFFHSLFFRHQNKIRINKQGKKGKIKIEWSPLPSHLHSDSWISSCIILSLVFSICCSFRFVFLIVLFFIHHENNNKIKKNIKTYPLCWTIFQATISYD